MCQWEEILPLDSSAVLLFFFMETSIIMFKQEEKTKSILTLFMKVNVLVICGFSCSVMRQLSRGLVIILMNWAKCRLIIIKERRPSGVVIHAKELHHKACMRMVDITHRG